MKPHSYPTEKHELEFEVLTDINSEYAREIGLVFTLPEHLRPVYADLGIELEKHNGAGQFDLPLAGTFVVDTDGTIACADVDADYTKWTEPSEVVAENKMIQDLIEEAKLEGGHVTACKGCADQLGLTEIIEGIDIEVIYQGPSLTQILKDDEKLLTI